MAMPRHVHQILMSTTSEVWSSETPISHLKYTFAFLFQDIQVAMVKSLIKTIAFLLALASICGLLVLKFDLLQYATAGRNLQKYEPSSASIVSEACRQNFKNIFDTENIEDTLKAVSVVVHKNGEAISCHKAM